MKTSTETGTPAAPTAEDATRALSFGWYDLARSLLEQLADAPHEGIVPRIEAFDALGARWPSPDYRQAIADRIRAANLRASRDAYDQAIERLVDAFVEAEDADAFVPSWPDAVYDAWSEPESHPGGILFDMTGWDGAWSTAETDGGMPCGCLTQVKQGRETAKGPMPCGVPRLTAEIQADDRIPTSHKSIKIHSLHAFAQWQRRIDLELDRPAPVWIEEESEWRRVVD